MKTIMKTTWEVISTIGIIAFWFAALPVLIACVACIGIRNAIRA